MQTPVFTASLLALSFLSAGPLLAAASVPKNPAPPASYVGQWYTTPGGCSYSRAQAPGYAPTWHLIINPHHIGQPPAKASCPPWFGIKS